MVKIGNGESKEVLIKKSNLDLISTEEDPCVSDDTVTGNECKLKLASDIYYVAKKFSLIFFEFLISILHTYELYF